MWRAPPATNTTASVWDTEPPTGKPRSNSEAICPLVGRACNQACHKCEFWEAFPAMQDGKEVHEWRCAIRWIAAAGPILAKRLDGTQKAAESLRNRFAEFRDSSLRLVAQVAQASGALMPPPAQPLLEAPDDAAP